MNKRYAFVMTIRTFSEILILVLQTCGYDIVGEISSTNLFNALKKEYSGLFIIGFLPLNFCR